MTWFFLDPPESLQVIDLGVMLYLLMLDVSCFLSLSLFLSFCVLYGFLSVFLCFPFSLSLSLALSFYLFVKVQKRQRSGSKPRFYPVYKETTPFLVFKFNPKGYLILKGTVSFYKFLSNSIFDRKCINFQMIYLGHYISFIHNFLILINKDS